MAKRFPLEILKVGSSIAYRPIATVNTPYEYFPLNNIKGIVHTFVEDADDRFGYRHANQCIIEISFIDPTWQPLRFDIQDIDNQAAWTPGDEVGIQVALTDINSWITSAAGGGGSPTPVVPGSLVLTEDDGLGGAGTEFIYVSTGVVTGKNYKYLVANEDSTFTTLAGSTTADLKTDLGITTSTVGKGMIIRGLSGETITDVTMLTGSVIGVL